MLLLSVSDELCVCVDELNVFVGCEMCVVMVCECVFGCGVFGVVLCVFCDGGVGVFDVLVMWWSEMKDVWLGGMDAAMSGVVRATRGRDGEAVAVEMYEEMM